MGLRCFVAMALGREDTDQVYDELIVPALRGKGITPVRVDRIEHNEDIDDRIISELGKCDLALADLTYARPSVYFEAGFAQRNVPVIYTCRKDHLSGKADDPYGNFRVHFDLQMKNIIAWSSAQDRGFQDGLGKRLRVVIRPLLRDIEAKEKLRREVERFSALSLEDRTLRVLNITVRRLKGAGYRGTWADEEALREYFGISIAAASISEWLRNFSGDPDHALFQDAMALKPGWIGTRRAPGVISAALVHVAPRLDKGHLRSLHAGLLSHPVYNLNRSYRGGPANLLVEHVYLCTLAKVQRARAEDGLQDFRWEGNMEAFSRTDVLQLPRPNVVAQHAKVFVGPGCEGFLVLNSRAKSFERRRVRCWRRGDIIVSRGRLRLGRPEAVQRRVYVHVLDGITSEKSFDARFSARVRAIGAQSSEAGGVSAGPGPMVSGR